MSKDGNDSWSGTLAEADAGKTDGFRAFLQGKAMTLARYPTEGEWMLIEDVPQMGKPGIIRGKGIR